MSSIIEVRELSCKYSEKGPYILENNSFEIERGSITAIAGLSGCGKSTLALCLCGAIPKGLPGITDGSIAIEGSDIRELSLPELSKRIGIVFQDVDDQLFLPTVEAEIAFAPENMCLPREEIGAVVTRVLKALGIEQLRDANPAKLSGGEKHLVAIASVMSLDPGIIILDEVFSQLDRDNKELIAGVIRQLKASGKTVIFIDHSIRNLLLADTILLMRAGRIVDRIEVGNDHEFLYGRLTEFFIYGKEQALPRGQL